MGRKSCRLIEFVIPGKLDDVAVELERLGVDGSDVVNVYFEPKQEASYESRPRYRVIAKVYDDELS